MLISREATLVRDLMDCKRVTSDSPLRVAVCSPTVVNTWLWSSKEVKLDRLILLWVHLLSISSILIFKSWMIPNQSLFLFSIPKTDLSVVPRSHSTTLSGTSVSDLTNIKLLIWALMAAWTPLNSRLTLSIKRKISPDLSVKPMKFKSNLNKTIILWSKSMISYRHLTLHLVSWVSVKKLIILSISTLKRTTINPTLNSRDRWKNCSTKKQE